MRSILEQAFDALLNEQHGKAEELFHKFMVERARQIHESIRQGEDYVLEENWQDELTTESYFGEEDLDGLDGEEGEEGAEGGDEGFSDEGDDLGAEGGEFGADDAADDLGGDLGTEGGEEGEFGEPEGDDASVADRLDDIEDTIEKFAAEFTAAMDALAGGDDLGDEDDLGAEGGEEDFGAGEGEDDGLGAEVDGAGEFGGEAPEDDMEDGEDQPMENAEYDDMMESIIDELEKVSVTLDDGKEIGTGSSFTQVKTAAIPQKSPDARQGGAPIKQKRDDHKSFERETAPSVADMKKRRNTKGKGTEGQSSVSKEGDKSAELNKLDSEQNTKSLF
jgi:hypothetical protein